MESQGLSVLGVVGIVFVILKLLGTITWSWWYVLMPFYIPLVIWLLISLVVFVILLFTNK